MIQKGSIRAKALGGLAVVAIVAAACSSSGASTAPSGGPRAAQPRSTHRLRQRWRRRQRLARVVDLLGEGAGVGVRRRRQGHRHQPRHGRGRSADRHPRPDRRRRQRDRHQPERSGRAEPGDRRGHRGRDHGHRGRRVRHRRRCLQPVQRPGRTTPTLAPRPCSSRWARRATSSTCAASPATRPTPTATPASRRPWPSIPDITVAKEVVTKWDPATAVSQINDIMSSGVNVRRRSGPPAWTPRSSTP